MRFQLIKYLACPLCRGELEGRFSKDELSRDHIHEGVLVCQQCSAEFPICEGIPKLAPSTGPF